MKLHARYLEDAIEVVCCDLLYMLEIERYARPSQNVDDDTGRRSLIFSVHTDFIVGSCYALDELEIIVLPHFLQTTIG